MTSARVTQDPVEVLERFDTSMRVTQDSVEVLERFDTNMRVTQAIVEVLFRWVVPTVCSVCTDHSDSSHLPPRVDALLNIGNVEQERAISSGDAEQVKSASGDARPERPIGLGDAGEVKSASGTALGSKPASGVAQHDS